MSDIVEDLMSAAKQLLDDRLCAEFGPCGGNPNAKLEDGLECKAAQEIKRLRQWVNDLQSGMYINCVYCGHRYGPKDEVPVSMADVLKQHIEVCPEHPMSKLKEENIALRQTFVELESGFRKISAEWYSKYIDTMKSKKCLGVEAKIESGKFGRDELDKHNAASEMIGCHRAFHSAAEKIKEAME